MRLAVGEPGEIEMPHSTYRSGSSSSWNPISVKEAPREDCQEKYSSSSSLSKRHIYRTSVIRCFGIDLSPDNMDVAIVYFVQGVLGLARLAISFYLKHDLYLDLTETALISGFASLPWLIKPLYGFISDSFPLFGHRRSKYDAALCILLGSLLVAFLDVVL